MSVQAKIDDQDSLAYDYRYEAVAKFFGMSLPRSMFRISNVLKFGGEAQQGEK